MTCRSKTRRARLGTAFVALAIGLGTVAAPAPAVAQSGAARPSETLNLSAGTGTLVRLPAPMSDVFVANDAVADVQVRSNRQLYIFGKGRGETTVYATGANGKVVYAANVRVGNNLGSVDEMLRLAMPEANVRATPMNNLVLLTGTVASPTDVEEAQRLVQAYVGEGTQVVSRLRSATPLQVNLKVRIAEVNRSLLKQVGVNLLTKDLTGGFQFGIGQGNPGTITGAGKTFNVSSVGTTLGAAGKLFGLDILSTLDLAETDGFVTTLAEPNLTALSGETASFLAGGEFPIPISQSLDSISIEYKQYGVGLAFTPIVLADGRISMRVRPEVSELSNEGSVKTGDFTVPALTTRRAETTVELGSGQSFMIAGLLRNSSSNDIEKAPFLGDLPILGALFRSTRFRRAETELVIVVTPYLVRPVSNQLALPTDGLRMPSDPVRVIEGQSYSSQGRPAASAPAPAPAFGGAAAAATPGFKL
ncbi:type II and III secretion system protein family protein [Sphingomonas sediminicola]|uniref:Type II and III secretion system protein family protein n=1 Tax=Sphingomonas sediminicola TaxID=386874 RepID=A0ABX6TAR2_9SPHN|nr:type II and III secretion system protein family protein [Sphingomonas sediminicola]QNP44718.1 type II and III secretion system protein family protein [Sphingomonas sediminicola]